jgi:hypothetical protein
MANNFLINNTTAILFYKVNSVKETSFVLVSICIFLSLLTDAVGDYIFSIPLFTNLSTLFIYLALFLQVVFSTLHLPKVLVTIFLYIFFQTFIIEFNSESFVSSFKHFLGLVIFSIVIFSYISVNRGSIIKIAKMYYQFTFGTVIIGLLQTLLFILFKISFIPQNLISGTERAGRGALSVEVLNIFPRSIGLSTEPAHYAIYLLPGVYMALMVLTGRGSELKIYSKLVAWILLFGFVLSFSLVGYFGLMICLISIFTYDLGKRLATKFVLFIFFVTVIFFIAQSSIGSKITSLASIQQDVTGYKYETSDLTGFALVSNILVAKSGLIKSNYLGTGLNTHKETYDASIYNNLDISQVIFELNKEDAGSLFIRVISEFGIPGFFLFIFLFFKYNLGNKFKQSPLKYLNRMCLIILICYSARNGSYLNTYFFLFLAIFYYTFQIQKRRVMTHVV